MQTSNRLVYDFFPGLSVESPLFKKSKKAFDKRLVLALRELFHFHAIVGSLVLVRAQDKFSLQQHIQVSLFSSCGVYFMYYSSIGKSPTSFGSR